MWYSFSVPTVNSWPDGLKATVALSIGRQIADDPAGDGVPDGYTDAVTVPGAGGDQSAVVIDRNVIQLIVRKPIGSSGLSRLMITAFPFSTFATNFRPSSDSAEWYILVASPICVGLDSAS